MLLRRFPTFLLVLVCILSLHSLFQDRGRSAPLRLTTAPFGPTGPTGPFAPLAFALSPTRSASRRHSRAKRFVHAFQAIY